jgi:hypothetical protein
VADRPVIFSGSMVRALLAGTKTQTRRVLKPQPGTTIADATVDAGPALGGIARRLEVPAEQLRVPYAVGDRLYVREAWAPLDALTHNDPGARALAEKGFYRADESTVAGEISKWRPSIHMPRWASRLTLEVTEVRVERLNDISEADARAEGMACLSKDGGRTWKHGIADRDGLPGTDDDGWPWSEWSVDPRRAYAALWNRLHGPDAWAANPWVAAISFRVIPANIDSLPEQQAGGRA